MIETSAAEEEESEICSSSGRRSRIRGIHERAPRKLLIAESSNSSRLATLHYSHFIEQLLLPPPITNTHRFTGTHTHTETLTFPASPQSISLPALHLQDLT